jgi:hypothetical protein
MLKQGSKSWRLGQVLGMSRFVLVFLVEKQTTSRRELIATNIMGKTTTNSRASSSISVVLARSLPTKNNIHQLLPSPSPLHSSRSQVDRSWPWRVISSILVAGQEGSEQGVLLSSFSWFTKTEFHHKPKRFCCKNRPSTSTAKTRKRRSCRSDTTSTTYTIMKMDGTRMILGAFILMMMTMLSVTNATHDAEDNATAAAASVVVTAAVASLSSTYVHVTIEATCSGVDWHKIPLSQDIFVGNELQRTFNEVHDDEHLINVKFEPMGKTFFGWTGDYNCLSCIRDDTLHAQWENAFASALAASGHKDVNKARKCKITMKAPMMMMRPSPPAVVVEEEPSLLDQEETTSTSSTMKEAAATVVVIIENAVHVEITKEQKTTIHKNADYTLILPSKCGLRACAES